MSHILKITTAFNSAVYDFERDLIRKVVRRCEALELLRELNKNMLELQHRESEGLLLLGKFEEHGVKGLVSRT